jgi:FkbM family methyltransferase
MSETKTGLGKLLSAIRWRVEVLSSPAVWEVYRAEKSRLWTNPTPVPVVVTAEDESLICVEVGGDSYWLPQETDLDGLGMIYNEVFIENQSHYYEWGKCLLRPGDVVVDIGACEGMFVRYALQKGCKVVAVEPWKPLFVGLERTFAQEIARGEVILLPVGISDTPGQATMTANPSEPWGAALENISSGSESQDTVKLLTLDELAEQIPWGRCDFVKMDIEGAEHQAIRSCQKVLQKYRACLSIAVYHYPNGYIDVRNQILRQDPSYEVVGKGLRHLGGVAFPRMLHAWPKERS